MKPILLGELGLKQKRSAICKVTLVLVFQSWLWVKKKTLGDHRFGLFFLEAIRFLGTFV